MYLILNKLNDLEVKIEETLSKARCSDIVRICARIKILRALGKAPSMKGLEKEIRCRIKKLGKALFDH